VDLFGLELDAPEEARKEIIEQGKDGKKDKAENGHEDGHQEVNDGHDLHVFSSEEKQWNANQGVNQSKENVEGHDDLAGLKNGYAGDLEFHGWVGW
jgi:predicted kinase